MNNGGSAFPFVPNQQMQLADGRWDQDTDFGDPGMSLRDWFAGMTQIGILASRDEQGRGGYSELSANEIARRAFIQADALLAERGRADRELDKEENDEHAQG